MGEVWPTAHITELCLQLTAGSRPVNGAEHRALRSQSCERALLTTGTLSYLPYFYFLRATAVPAGTAVARISYGNSVCPSVYPSVCLSRPGGIPSPGEIDTPGLHHMIA